MRNTRPPEPSSTLSSNSGHSLVYGTHRSRGPKHSFTAESTEPVTTKRKTRLIVILGVALPVLACVIGIAAWAVTTDVLRITPRANDNSFNRFGHQGKTRIDDLQSRSDQDVDVFVLHGITPPTSSSSSPATSTKKVASTTIPTTESPPSTIQAMNSPKASDILSKLISDMPPPRNPKNFVVFAPIPETENTGNLRKGRRLDRKVVFRDSDDLVAEESVISEDTSQEVGFEKINFNRKRIQTTDNPSLKLGMGIPAHRKLNKKEKSVRNPRILHEHALEGAPNFIKRPQQGEFVAYPPNTKSSANTITNRNGGNTVPNSNFQRNNFPSPQHNTVFQNKNIKLDQQSFRGPHQSFENTHAMTPNQNYQNPSFQPPVSTSFNNKENSPQFQAITSSGIQNKDNNVPLQHYQRSPSFQKLHNIESATNNFSPLQSSPQANFASSPLNTFSPDNSPLNPSYSNSQQKPFTMNNSPPGPSYSNSPQNTFSPENSPMGSGGPQYFAPPPQTFHTKINYEQPSKISSSPSVATYEKVAHSTIDSTATEGAHHHHHHHHHHEPVPSNSDPIGDVNYSDVPRSSDADRLGSIGIGLGPSRGITLQIGGGGLGGLLPLGTLGIAKHLVSALLPRPSLGLNSKVFLGVEVGKGSGFSIG